MCSVTCFPRLDMTQPLDEHEPGGLAMGVWPLIREDIVVGFEICKSPH